MSDYPAPNARILIVEDEAIVALDVRHRVERLGYVPVRTVSSAEEAISAAAADDPDLVLMDIQLGGAMDGIEAAGIIREESGKPVVFLTAYSDRSSLERAKVADAFGYVLKPFEERELGIAIEMALYKERMQRRLTESREWLHGTVGALFDGVVTTDAAGTILFMNRRAAELTGWPEEEAFGRSVDEVVRTETIPQGEFRTEILPEAVRLLRRDGSVSYVERRVSEIGVGDGPADAGVSGRAVVLRDVADILTYEREMRAAREQAERALQVKSEFLANVTHELRTPLNSVLGMADLAHGLASDKRQREYLGILKSSAENLFGLITSILDLSRIESGHLALSPADVDLHQLLESVVESFALEAQNKGLSLEFALDPETPAVVHGDRVRLAQIVTNLVANAVKYTDSGRVTVSVSPGVRISVVDTGPGIPAGQHEAVFQPFTQLDGGPTRAHGGAGIGLAVARELAELMGGRIDLDSAEGRGSTFRVEVPLEVVAEPRDRTPKDAPSPVAKRAVLVGAPGPTRDSLAAWARSIGVEVSAVAAAELSSVPEPGTVDLVLVPGQEPGISRREISEAFPRATVWTSGVLGSAATEDDAQRVLSRPVMPSTFVRLLCEHSGGNASPEAGSGGPVDAGQTTEEAARALVERFAPDALEAHHLDDLAAAARRAREDSEGLGGRVEEMLFRLTLAARRGDLDGSRELLSKIGGGGGRIGQTTQLHYNVER